MRAVVLLALLAGCDQLFDLDRLPDPAGTTGDGSVIGDASRIDAAPCIDDGRDEDSDGRSDSCDACPTVAQSGAQFDQDDDSDGLPNACDPDLSMRGDRIVFAAMFASSTDLTGSFTFQNTSHSASNGGVLTLGNNAVLTTNLGFMPTKIELRVGGIFGAGFNSETVLRAPSAVACHVHSADCNGTNTSQTCITMEPATGQAQAALPTSSLTKVDLYREGATIVCRAEVAPGNGLMASAPALFDNGAISIQTSPTGSASVRSLVIYGAR